MLKSILALYNFVEVMIKKIKIFFDALKIQKNSSYRLSY